MKWRDILEAKSKLDQEGFLDEYLTWGEKFLNAYEKTQEYELEIQRGLVMGMGGSGIVGDIIKMYTEHKKDVIIDVYKHWEIPIHRLGTYDVLIFVSFSGNTIETVQAFRKAVSQGLNDRIIAITTDGILANEAKKVNIRVAIIKGALAPRSGLPQLLGSTLKLLKTTLGESLDKEVEKVAEKLKIDAKENYIDKRENRAFNIAYHIWGRYPIFYGTPISQPILTRAKAMINENAKLSGYYQIFPEGYHNEVEIFDEQVDPVLLPLIIRWENEKDIFKPLTDYMEEKDIEYYEIVIKGDTYLEYLMRGIILLDMASIYLAYLTRRRPLDTNVIKYIKERRKIE